MSTASKVAASKEKHPERFCPQPRCLWRTDGQYCPRHHQHSDPTRENDPHALPDVEVWPSGIVIIRSKCGDFEVPSSGDSARGFCPSCERATCVLNLPDGIEHTGRQGWFWWTCLPDGEPHGPFETEAEALADAKGA